MQTVEHRVPMSISRFQRPRKTRRSGAFAGDSLRAFLAGVGVAALIAIAFAMSGTVRPTADRETAAATGFGEGEGEGELRSAAILFVPFQGNNCRQNVFDNLSGRIWFFGYVDCGVAIARNAGATSPQWSAARVDAIRDGFRKQ